MMLQIFLMGGMALAQGKPNMSGWQPLNESAALSFQKRSELLLQEIGEDFAQGNVPLEDALQQTGDPSHWMGGPLATRLQPRGAARLR